MHPLTVRASEPQAPAAPAAAPGAAGAPPADADPVARPPGPAFADAQFSDAVCCWNVCGSWTGPPNRPRASATGMFDSAVAAAGGPGAPSGARPRHLTRRLLVETVAPGRHVLFNPLSGAVDRATDTDLVTLERLRAGGPVPLDPAQERRLRERLYLFDDPAAEEACLEAAVAGAWGRMAAAQPEMYTVCPTLACNLACGYCFEGDSLHDKPQGVMTEAQVARLFDAIGRLRAGYAAHDPAAAGPPWLSLFGGEPFLPSTRRAVAAILGRAAAEGFLVAATTNGVNLARFEDLLTEHAEILTVFQVTLDGPKAVHDARRHRLGGQGTFEEVVRGIDLLLFLGVGVDLRVNLDAANVDALPALVDFLHAKGWPAHPAFALALAPVTVHDAPRGHDAPGTAGGAGGCRSRYDRALSELELARRVMALAEAHPRVAALCHLGFLRHLEYLVSVLEPERLGPGRRRAGRAVGPRYWYCEASTDKQYVFTPEGLVYSCTEGVGRPEHAVGRFDPALELWAAERGQWVGRTILSHPKCRECAISTLCGGGCHVAARERAGAAGERLPGERLLQVALPGRGTTRRAPERPPSSERPHAPEPFCNAAEETVRAYLRAVAAGPAFRERVGGLL
ncbi:MAG: SPASM domain-containing protein [Armatimonadetes bacterium]|nr:SPASM domain-containing protein [Armatimonadota bacterium]